MRRRAFISLFARRSPRRAAAPSIPSISRRRRPWLDDGESIVEHVAGVEDYRRIPVRRRATFVVPERERPHPRRSYGCRVYLQDAADNSAISKHVEIILVPLARGPAGRGPFE